MPTGLFEHNWMYVKDKSIWDLCLLESHDSCSWDVRPEWGIAHDNASVQTLNNVPSIVRRLSPSLQYLAVDFARTQDLSLDSQLRIAGVRSFDIRVAWNNGRLVTHHTFLGYSFLKILTEIERYLAVNSKECVVLKIKWTDARPFEDLTLAVVEDMQRTDTLMRMLVPRAHRTWTIEQLVQADQRVFCFLDRVDMSPALTTLPIPIAGHLYEFLDRYINTDSPQVKLQEIRNQMNALMSTTATYRALYTINWTLTPQIRLFATNLCLQLLRVPFVQANLSSLSRKLDDPLQVFQPCELVRASSLSIDFVRPNLVVAEALLTIHSRCTGTASTDK